MKAKMTPTSNRTSRSYDERNHDNNDVTFSSSILSPMNTLSVFRRRSHGSIVGIIDNPDTQKEEEEWMDFEPTGVHNNIEYGSNTFMYRTTPISNSNANHLYGSAIVSSSSFDSVESLMNIDDDSNVNEVFPLRDGTVTGSRTDHTTISCPPSDENTFNLTSTDMRFGNIGNRKSSLRKMTSEKLLYEVPVSEFQSEGNKTPTTMSLLELPCSQLAGIFQFLDLRSIQSCQCTCRKLYRHIRLDSAQQRAVWEPIYRRMWPWLYQDVLKSIENHSTTTTITSTATTTQWRGMYTNGDNNEIRCLDATSQRKIVLREEFKLSNPYRFEKQTTFFTAVESRNREGLQQIPKVKNITSLSAGFPNHSTLLGLATSRQPTGIDSDLVDATCVYCESTVSDEDDEEYYVDAFRDDRNELSPIDSSRRILRIEPHPLLAAKAKQSNDNATPNSQTPTTVRYVGAVGVGSRSVQANQPLPKPSSGKHHKSCFLSRQTNTSLPTNCRRMVFDDDLDDCLPFVVPFCCKIDDKDAANEFDSNFHPDHRFLVDCPLTIQSCTFQLSPRFIAYYEVAILPQNASTPVRLPARRHRGGARPNGGRDHAPQVQRNDCIAVGLAFGNRFVASDRIHNCMPGWDTNTVGYHSDNGRFYDGNSIGIGRSFGPMFGVGDVVGCGVDYYNDTVFYTLNGEYIDAVSCYHSLFRQQRRPLSFDESMYHQQNAFKFKCSDNNYQHNIPNLYPVVGIDSRCPVSFNFGTGDKPFMYNLLPMMNQQKEIVLAHIFRPRKYVAIDAI